MLNHFFQSFIQSTAYVLCLFFALGVVAQQNSSVSYPEVAHNIIRTSARVKPGEKVVIQGGIKMIPFMEALATEAANAGGRPTMLLTSDQVQHSYLVNVSDESLNDPGLFVAMAKEADVFIGLALVDDTQRVYDGIPLTRLQKIFKGYQLEGNAIAQSRARSISVITPVPALAEFAHMDFPAFQKAQWDAINTDYSRIAQQGKQLRDSLMQAKDVHITSSSGTDFRLSPGNRQVSLSVGVPEPGPAETTDLPAGELTFFPNGSSGNGTIVALNDTCKKTPLVGAVYEFTAGKLAAFKAEKNGDCFDESIRDDQAEAKQVLSISIGLNPGFRFTNDEVHIDPMAEGMVYVNLGSNKSSEEKPSVSWAIPLTNATVEIDGKTFIRNGKLLD